MSLSSPSQVRFAIVCIRTLSVTVLYTFSIKAKWRTNALWVFAVQSSTVAYLCTSVPLGLFIVDQVPERFDGNSATDT